MGGRACTPLDGILQFLFVIFTCIVALKMMGHEGTLQQIPACSGENKSACMSVYGGVWLVLAIGTWVVWVRDKTPLRADGGFVKITVVEARNLAKRDISSESDPFAFVELCSDPSWLPYTRSVNNHHHNEYKTPVVEDDPNPKWNHDITFKSSRDAAYLVVTVWDKDWLDSCWRWVTAHNLT
jgi:hypothetical protein